MQARHLLIFGYGYTSAAIARRLIPLGWRISGTTRSASRFGAIAADGATPLLFGPAGIPDAAGALSTVTHTLSSAPPGDDGDPALVAHAADLARAPHLRWLGYLSTTGVYGDAGGGWVDETTPAEPVHDRARRRVDAEAAWTALAGDMGKTAAIFRLPGIYGPGRSTFDNLKAGTAKRMIKQGQVFSRIHVDDIAAAVAVAAGRDIGGVFNVADDEPAPPQDVVTCAAELLGIAPPPEEDFEAVKHRLSPMALEFYGASRRISNRKMRETLGVDLAYPTYREGLRGILAQAGN
jgi:nucleoside-diphosphate-sugar epimerase